VFSDKLFFWLFQGSPDRILPLLDGLPADAHGYSFSAPVLKEREYRLDGLFLPPANRPDLPALILEAQMGPDPGFLRRLYAETARLLQQEPDITNWRVVVITPSRQLNLGAADPVAEFLERRVSWVELQPERGLATAPLFQRLLALLVQPEADIPAVVGDLRRVTPPAATAGDQADLLKLIPTILVARFNDRPIEEICAMAGITVDDFTQSVAYRQIFGLGKAEGKAEGEARGEARGKAEEAAVVTLRLLTRRCGPLSPAITARIEALPLEHVEALAEALLDFQGPADLDAWLAAHD
jgi:predicted transposase YdaD